MRADGLKNRLAILRAASKIFARQGFNAPLELIAIEAGVSRATLYRNFANREELGLAIFDRNASELEEYARQITSGPDGFLLVLTMMMEQFAKDAGLVDAVHRPGGMQRILALKRRVLDILEPLLHTAQIGGVVRSDFSRSDLELLLAIFGRALPKGDTDVRTAQGVRLLEIVLPGILVR